MFMQHTKSTTSAASETKLVPHIMLKASSRAPCVDGAPPISKPCRKALSCQIVEYPSFFCVIVERWARGLSPVSVIPPMGLAPLSQYHGMVWYEIPWYGMVWYGMVIPIPEPKPPSKAPILPWSPLSRCLMQLSFASFQTSDEDGH